MQLLIDTSTASARNLRLYSALVALLAHAAEGAEYTDDFLDTLHAAAKPGVKPTRPAAPPIVPDKRPAAPVIPLPPGNTPPPPVIHPELHPEGQPHVPAVPEDAPAPPAPENVPAGTMDPAVVFGGAPANPTLTTATSVTVPAAPAVPSAGAPAAEKSEPTQTGPASSAATVERDSEGLPWDDRVHSETRKKNADGTWRYRRNLDKVIKDAVYAELKAAAQVSLPQSATGVAGAVPVPAPTPPVSSVGAAADSVPPPPPANTGAVPDAPPPPNNVVSLHGAPPVPVSAEAAPRVPDAPQPPVVSASPVTGFRDLMTKVNQAMAAGRLSQTQLTQACKDCGVEGIAALVAQPMLVPTLDAKLNAMMGIAA